LKYRIKYWVDKFPITIVTSVNFTHFFAVYFTGCKIGKGCVKMNAILEEKAGLSNFVMWRPCAASLVSAKLKALLCSSSWNLKIQKPLEYLTQQKGKI
jgi:hypothetical protein